MTDLKAILPKIPKAELHVHLKGAMPVEVFTAFLNKYVAENVLETIPAEERAYYGEHDNIRPFLSPRQWSSEEVLSLFCYDDFDQFLATWLFTGHFIRDAVDFRTLVTAVIENLRSQNVVYAEITVAPPEYLHRGIALEDMIGCLEEGAAIPGIRVQWIIDLVRNNGVPHGVDLLKRVIQLHAPSIVGITLGGAEHLFPPAQFAPVYDVARNHGLRLTVHAGEASGPESVWDALRVLGAERIGHGVRAIEDESLISYIVEQDIGLEVCPTSNVRTGIYPSLEAHPVKDLYEAGVPVTINSDDPTFFGTTMAEEYARANALGIPEEGILRMIENGFKYAFLPEDEVRRYLDDVEREWGRLHTEGQ